MWEITKQFEFEYGHRVWSQTLQSNFSIDSYLACRHLHGHHGTVLVTLNANILENGMVTDFKHLNWFKKFIDDNLDHKFIIDKHDPIFEKLTGNNPDKLKWPEGSSFTLCNYWDDISNAEKELVDSFIVVNFLPTSENLSQWLYQIVSHRMLEIGINVKSVQFFETPKSDSKYIL